MDSHASLTVEKIEDGYMIRFGDKEEYLIGSAESQGILIECKRVAQILDVRAAEVLTAIRTAFIKEVDEILTNETPLESIGYLLDDAIAGEDDNKRLLFVLLLSAITQDPEYCEMILFKSSSGGGKSTLANYITGFYRVKKVGRLSRTALDYTDLENQQILYLQELGKMDNEEYGVSTVKFLSTEDEGYTIEITVRDPGTNQMTTMQKKIPPLTVISSTTRVNIDGQYERRNWIMSVDETPEQTTRIREMNAKHEIEKTEINLSLRKDTSKQRATRILKALVDAIEPRKVSILFPNTLMSVLKSKKLRIRGDFKKILRLVTYYSWLKQHTIPRLKINGEQVLFPTPKDALEILQVAVKSLIFMTQDLEGRDLKLLEGMEVLEITQKNAQITPTLRDELRLKLGYTKSTILTYLNHLVDRGFLTDDDNKPKTYTLVKSLASIKRDISSVSETIMDPGAFMLEMTREATRNYESLVARKAELEPLRPFFNYEPNEDSFGNHETSVNNPQNGKVGLNIPHSEDLGFISPQKTIPKQTPSESLDVPPIENPLERDQRILENLGLRSKAFGLIRRTGESTTKEIGDYLDLELLDAALVVEGALKAKIIKNRGAGKWTLRDKSETISKRQDQGTLIPDPLVELPSNEETQLQEDIIAFKQAIWNHQEEQKLESIKFEDLMKRLEWSQDRFNTIKDLVRANRIPAIIEPRPGWFAYSW
jgi:hypothetical protein